VRDLLKGRIQPRRDTFYLLTRAELDQIAETGLIKTLDITIASTLFGVLISLAIWLLTIGSDAPIQLGAAIGSLCTLAPLFLLFSLRAYQSHCRAKDILRKIMECPPEWLEEDYLKKEGF
jgi:hypothetical protein